MTISIICYFILLILAIALPIKYKCRSRSLLTIASLFMGAAIITAIFHSDLGGAKWIIVGLNSIGMMSYYIRYRIMKSENEKY